MDFKGHFTGNFLFFTIKYMFFFFSVKIFPVNQSIDSTNYQLVLSFLTGFHPEKAPKTSGTRPLCVSEGAVKGAVKGLWNLFPRINGKWGGATFFRFPST